MSDGVSDRLFEILRDARGEKLIRPEVTEAIERNLMIAPDLPPDRFAAVAGSRQLSGSGLTLQDLRRIQERTLADLVLPRPSLARTSREWWDQARRAAIVDRAAIGMSELCPTCWLQIPQRSQLPPGYQVAIPQGAQLLENEAGEIRAEPAPIRICECPDNGDRIVWPSELMERHGVDPADAPRPRGDGPPAPASYYRRQD